MVRHCTLTATFVGSNPTPPANGEMEMRQLCWNCKNTNSKDCEWFSNCNKHPSYCVVKKGYIIECDKFIEDTPQGKRNVFVDREIWTALKVNRRTYYRHKQEYKKEFYEKLKKGEICL